MPMRTFTLTLPNVLIRHVISFTCIPWPFPFSSPFFYLSFLLLLLSPFLLRAPPSTHRIQLTAAAATYTYSSIQQHPHTAAAAYSSGTLPQRPSTPAAAVPCKHSLQQDQHTPTAVYSSSLPSLSSSDHPLTVLSPCHRFTHPPWG